MKIMKLLKLSWPTKSPKHSIQVLLCQSLSHISYNLAIMECRVLWYFMRGCRMLIKFRMLVSDIRMYELTNTLIENFKYKINIIYHKPFRDDGFIISNSDCINEIHELFKIANSIHPLLKFIYSISESEITFLDTTVYMYKGERYMESRILDIKSYIKPTNNFQYLYRSSSHP